MGTQSYHHNVAVNLIGCTHTHACTLTHTRTHMLPQDGSCIQYQAGASLVDDDPPSLRRISGTDRSNEHFRLKRNMK